MWANSGWQSDAGAWYKNKVVAAGYSGPGDVLSFILWGSVARGYSAAVAATGTQNAMDLVDQAGANPITIKVLTTGLTDVASINAWVTAHTVTTIKVTKLYDQVGTNHWVQATLAVMPSLTLSAINGLPALTFSSASSTRMSSGSALSQAQTYTFEAVANRSANNGDGTIMVAGNPSLTFAYNGGTGGLIQIYAGGGSVANASATDPQYHVMQAAYADTASTINVDGVQTTPGLAVGTGSANAALFIGSTSVPSSFLDGNIAEVGIYAGAYNAGVQSNARTAYGL